MGPQQLLYGRRRQGRGPRPENYAPRPSLDRLRQQLRDGQLPDWLVEDLPDLKIVSSMRFAESSAFEVNLAGFPDPYQQRQLMLAFGFDDQRNYLRLMGDSTTKANTPAEVELRLLHLLANNIAHPERVEVLWHCDRPEAVDHVLDHQSHHSLALINNLGDRSRSEAEELKIAFDAALEEDIYCISDLIAASDMVDFFTYSRDAQATLRQLASYHSFFLAKPLQSYRSERKVEQVN